jgi:hypothetical protein
MYAHFRALGSTLLRRDVGTVTSRERSREQRWSACPSIRALSANHSHLVGSRKASWHILLVDAAPVWRERAHIRWEPVGGATGVTMKENLSVAPQKLAHLQQVAWQNVNEPGAYVEAGTGNLYRFPPEALITGSSPVVRRENHEGGVLVQLSRDPFITTFEARMLAAECNIKPNF